VIVRSISRGIEMAEKMDKGDKEQEWKYGFMESTEVEMGLPAVIPFRIRPAPPPDKEETTEIDWVDYGRPDV